MTCGHLFVWRRAAVGENVDKRAVGTLIIDRRNSPRNSGSTGGDGRQFAPGITSLPCLVAARLGRVRGALNAALFVGTAHFLVACMRTGPQVSGFQRCSLSQEARGLMKEGMHLPSLA